MRSFVRKRLMDPGRVEGQLKELDQMLLTLHHGGFVDAGAAPARSGTVTKPEGEEVIEEAVGPGSRSRPAGCSAGC